MEELENKLNQILANPEMREKVMTLAQSLGGTPPGKESEGKSRDSGASTGLDLSMLQKISSLATQTGIDPDQRNLIGALRPYLSPSRIGKLERAMRAAKMASMAGVFTGKHPSGR